MRSQKSHRWASHPTEWSTPLHLNNSIYSRNIRMQNMMVTCSQQTRGLRCMKIGPRLLLKWPKHFIFFPGAYSSTQRWHNLSWDKYINYFSQIVWNINIFLQEDQLMHTKAGFSLVPVPGSLPNSNDLDQKNADQISQTGRLVLLTKIQHWQPESKLDPPIITLIVILFPI